MNKFVFFVILLLLFIPVVLAGIFDIKIPKPNLPSYEESPISQLYPQQQQAAPQFRRDCNLGETKCDGRNFMQCMADGTGNIVWFTVSVCENDQSCRTGEGCMAAFIPQEEQRVQPIEEPQQQTDIRQALNIRLPEGLIPQVEQEPQQPDIYNLPQVLCNLEEVTCSADQKRIITCRNNRWTTQERCPSDKKCVIGLGCVKTETETEYQGVQPGRPEYHEISYQNKESPQIRVLTKEEKLTEIEKKLLNMLIEEREKNLQLQKEISSLKEQIPTEEKPEQVKEGFFSRIWRFIKNVFT